MGCAYQKEGDLIAIVKIKSSKSTRKRDLAYVLNPLKVSLIKLIHLDPNRDINVQMEETARLWQKCQNKDSRKYYYFVISFDPNDVFDGRLTDNDVMDIALLSIEEYCANHETVLAVHVDKDHLHVHIIINAVDLTGKMLSLWFTQYDAFKDRVQDLCAQRGLTAIDWRTVTQNRRNHEKINGPPIRLSLAEQRMELDGKPTIKGTLRSVINHVLITSKDFYDYQVRLSQYGVNVARATEDDICYEFFYDENDSRKYRGHTLGSDYTMFAIKKQLTHNIENGGVDKMIRDAQLRAAHRHPLTDDEILMMHEIGQLVGLSRDSVNKLIDAATSPNVIDITKAYDWWQSEQDRFWKTFHAKRNEIDSHLDSLYQMRHRLQQVDWLLRPDNTALSLFGVILAWILRLTYHTPLSDIDAEIEYYKQARVRLQRCVNTFKSAAEKGLQGLKASDIHLDDYIDTIAQMHAAADLAFGAILDVPLERQYVLTERGMVSKAELLSQHQRMIAERDCGR